MLLTKPTNLSLPKLFCGTWVRVTEIVEGVPGGAIGYDPEGRVLWAIFNPDGSLFRTSNGRFYGHSALDDARAALITYHMVTWTKISIALSQNGGTVASA